MVNDTNGSESAATYAPEHEAPAEVTTPATPATPATGGALTPADQLAAKLAKSREDWRRLALLQVECAIQYGAGLPPGVDPMALIDALAANAERAHADRDTRTTAEFLRDVLQLDAEIAADEASLAR